MKKDDEYEVTFNPYKSKEIGKGRNSISMSLFGGSSSKIDTVEFFGKEFEHRVLELVLNQNGEKMPAELLEIIADYVMALFSFSLKYNKREETYDLLVQRFSFLGEPNAKKFAEFYYNLIKEEF